MDLGHQEDQMIRELGFSADLFKLLMGFSTQEYWSGSLFPPPDFFLGCKISVDGDCSHEIKRHLLLGKANYGKPRQRIKRRDITLPTNICIVKAMVFPVVMYGCETWTIKKAEG